uniref:Uncharacterized protein n=1 Tax=Anguilla anguilla TaxID=7936 RepID=A0A0E9PJY9_ANGAN
MFIFHSTVTLIIYFSMPSKTGTTSCTTQEGTSIALSFMQVTHLLSLACRVSAPHVLIF